MAPIFRYFSKLRFFAAIALFFSAAMACAETVTLYNDNGEGGIHRSNGKLVVTEGQYYVDVTVETYGGRTKTERLKVYRVKDSARLYYEQPRWAEKLVYIVYNNRTDYYFNMKSPWRPPLTEDPDDPARVVPIKKITAYRDDWNGGYDARKFLLVKKSGSYMLYYGDDFFGALVCPNDPRSNDGPAWSKKFKYFSVVSGLTYYYNIN